MGQWGQKLRDAGLPGGRAGISKLEARGLSTGFVSPLPSPGTPASSNCIRAALPTCIPDWSQPGPSCIPGLEEAEGPGLFVLPKSGLRTMTGLSHYPAEVSLAGMTPPSPLPPYQDGTACPAPPSSRTWVFITVSGGS